jgi:hypothetical protein
MRIFNIIRIIKGMSRWMIMTNLVSLVTILRLKQIMCSLLIIEINCLIFL